ncbi:ABC transporter substrate-binding protein [Streptomyces sp. NBC_00269]|uniref:ABC transporter substrate-binding protein n=1 Tax=Streptomyces sp. NBC_00269 TaxID=2975696 RepID=UPI002E28DFCB|nr:ABC transporter substrate-binding protein [Streptomyces sp. NBC_00269]
MGVTLVRTTAARTENGHEHQCQAGEYRALLHGQFSSSGGSHTSGVHVILRAAAYPITRSAQRAAWPTNAARATGPRRTAGLFLLPHRRARDDRRGTRGLADSILPEGIACRADAGKPQQDLGRAKALIREAGAGGKTVTIAYQPTVDEFNVAGTILQDSLKKIGLKAELQAVTFPQYSERVSKQSTMPDIALAWDFASYPEAGPQLNREYNSAFAGSTNYTWYSDRQVDRCLKEGNTAPTASKACAAFTQAQNKILADHALLYIAYPAITVLSDGRVKNIPFSPTQRDFNVGFPRRLSALSLPLPPALVPAGERVRHNVLHSPQFAHFLLNKWINGSLGAGRSPLATGPRHSTTSGRETV